VAHILAGRPRALCNFLTAAWEISCSAVWRQADGTVTWMSGSNDTFTSGGSYVSECVTKVKVEPAGQPAHDSLHALQRCLLIPR
jgi:hypothetical protein